MMVDAYAGATANVYARYRKYGILYNILCKISIFYIKVVVN